MPGIVGLITEMPREWAEPQLRRMVESLSHEPSYRTGTWVEESLGLYVGWVIQKDTFADGIPVCNERGDMVLVFAGEEYPERGIKQQLKERGHTIKTEGPSYLVHLAEEDPFFPAGLNGRFQGLLVDRARQTLKLFNDRYGMYRIYYHESQEAFYFSVEAKAILAVRPETRTADPQGLGEYIACGCVLENRTLFQGIQVLPPGSAWTFQNWRLQQKDSYFDPREWESQSLLDEESYYQQVQQTFSRNLSRYFNGRQPIGMSLTGGLDSRMVMAWHKAEPGALPCYSFGGMFRDCQDVRVARDVAEACGQPHEVIPVGKDFLSQFPHYAERTIYLTDGCADVGRCPDLYINERAATIAPVRMTGNYGGEVLRRVRCFKPIAPAPGLFGPEIQEHIRGASATYERISRVHPLTFAVFRQAPWHHYGMLAIEQTQLSLRSPFLDNDFIRTVYRAPDSACTDNDVCLRLIADGDAALARIPTDRGLGGSQNPLWAAASRQFHEFAFKAEYAYDYGMPQWLARIDHRLAPLHPERLFLGRHKFNHFRVWYRDFLSDYVRDMLLDSRTLSRPYLEGRTLEAMVNHHLRGDGNYTTVIHKVLTMEILHRVFLDN